MYRGRPDAAEATAKRLRAWESGGDIGLAEAALVSILQVARGWSDVDVAAQAGAISDSDAETLCDVFVMLQRLRMGHQVSQIEAGHTPGDVITMSELSPLNRSLLNDGLREIVGVQRRLRNVGMMPG